MAQVQAVFKVLVLVLCLWCDLAHSTLFTVEGRLVQRCWTMPNCELCDQYDCLRCRPGYNRLARDIGIRCVRKCPLNHVVQNRMCRNRHPGCPYGVPYCEKCTKSTSCDRCIAGYSGLRQGAPHSTSYRCVKKCPQRFVPVTVPGFGQRCQPSGCRKNGDCIHCPGVTKCLTCQTGYKLLVDLIKQDMTCVPAPPDRILCRVDNRGCLLCNDYRRVQCIKCKANKRATVGPDGQSVVCRPISDPCTTKQCPPYAACNVVNGKAVCECILQCSPHRAQPVCGSDGKTYQSQCRLRRTACQTNTQIGVASKGLCPDPCDSKPCKAPYAVCTAIQGRPVCSCKTDCTGDTTPVCGSDYKNYRSKCLMELMSCNSGKLITVQSSGRCPDPCLPNPCTSPYAMCKSVKAKATCICPNCGGTRFSPVCGSDGLTYNNLCYLQFTACTYNDRIASAYEGRCRDPCATKTCKDPYSQCIAIRGQAKCQCINNCTRALDQVCGSDFKTYPNLCLMRLSSCKSKKMVTFSSKGECRDPCKAFPCMAPHSICQRAGVRRRCTCNTNCTQLIDRVCGTDGRTYNNECLMRLRACQTINAISVFSRGACRDHCANKPCRAPHAICTVVGQKAECSCSLNCSVTESFVCGSDGKTYDNECKMKIKACKSNKLITVASGGKCRDPCDAVGVCQAPYSICSSARGRAVCSCPTCPDGQAVVRVCGSNKKIYQSACEMRRESCRTNVVITVRPQGECAGPCSTKPCRRPYAICRNVNGRAVCDCPNFCPNTYQPVCGSDGKTYGSECLLEKGSCENNVRINIVNRTKCPDIPSVCKGNPCANRPYSICIEIGGKPMCECKKSCSEVSNPVCGSDGFTYPNECFMRRKACDSGVKLVVRFNGVCRVTSLCTGNPCLAERPYSTCATSNGKYICHCKKSCPQDIQYVCGSDGRTYKNQCLLEGIACESKQNITRANYGQCTGVNPCAGNPCAGRLYSTCTVQNNRAFCECNKVCPTINKRVCGSDGVTYDNECKLRQTACRTNSNITVVSRERCGSPNVCAGNPCADRPYSTCTDVNGLALCKCKQICTDDVKPVCGTDGKSYANKCLMELEGCRTKTFIRKSYDGRCTGVNPCTGNPCAGRLYSTCTVQNNRAFCECNKVCPTINKRVCGSDGVTYDNECNLKQTACRTNNNITVVSRGGCGSPISNPCDNNPCASRPYSFCRIHKDIAGCACPDNCTEEYYPVCGDNGKTYSSECALQRQACRTNIMIRVKFQRACQASCRLINNCLVCPGQKPTKCTECPEGYIVELSPDGNTLLCRQQPTAVVAPTLSCRFVDSCWICAGTKRKKCAVCPTGYVAVPKVGEKHTVQCVWAAPQASNLAAGCLDLACKTCRVGWYRLEYNGQSCYRQCPQGYYPSGQKCAKCPASCEVCYTSQTCYKCKPNLAKLYKSAIGVQCVQRCPRHYRRELVKGTLICTSSICNVQNCVRCGGSPLLCDKCDADFYKLYSSRTGEDRCLTYCPNGFRSSRAENGGFICVADKPHSTQAPSAIPTEPYITPIWVFNKI